MAATRARNIFRTRILQVAFDPCTDGVGDVRESGRLGGTMQRPQTNHVARRPSDKKPSYPGKTEVMKAVRIHNYGGPEVLRYEDVPKPSPAPGEVLIRVHAAGVNPVDWKVREGALKQLVQHKFPLTLGWDLSGVIEEVGPDGAGGGQFKKGDEVFSKPDTSRDGDYADYIVVRESEVALKPKSLHHVYAAAVPLAGLAAWQALFDIAQLKRGQRVLIHAGSGGVGHFAVQFAKWKGAYVIATASTQNQPLLRQIGVDQPVDYTTQRFEQVATDIDVVLDTIGGDTLNRSWQVLKKGGVLVSLVQPSDTNKARQLGVRSAFVWTQPNGKQLAEIADLIDSGHIKVVLDRILPLSEARRAHELSQSGHTRGKIVLRVKGGQTP
jgi:NADPH:quinone reductase-like Zn-dependent oxidoreductase